MSKLLVERQDAVTVLTLNRPEVHNNVDDETAMLLADAIDAFAAEDAAKVLVITGAGDRTFCAGANLKGMAELFQHRRTYDAGPMGFARLDPDKPVIGAINGACYAGGVELAVWCDFRIVDERAKFGLLNKRWGLSLADGGTQRLPRVVGIVPGSGRAARWPTRTRPRSRAMTRTSCSCGTPRAPRTCTG
jgi:enoyl-CoA hydratase